MRTTTVKSLVAMPSIVMGFTDGHPPIGPASPFGNSQEIFRKRGTDGSNPVPPPPVSLSQPGPADAVGQSRGCGAGPVLLRDVRKGRGGCDQTLFGPVSLSPIDAVPVRESSDRSQRRAGRGGGRGLRHISGLCAQLASSLRCSVQSKGRSSSVSRVAVSSIGCRPCKIASTSSGLKKARPTSRRI